MIFFYILVLVVSEAESITVTYIKKKKKQLQNSRRRGRAAVGTNYLAGKQVAEIRAGSVEMLKNRSQKAIEKIVVT